MTAAEALSLWEQARREIPARRAAALLAPLPSFPVPADPARMPVGRRDAHLMEMRAHLFGPIVRGVATCPACQQKIEFDTTITDLQLSHDGPNPEVATAITAQVNGYHVIFRLPDTLDLADTAEFPDVVSARRHLFERCIVSAHDDAGQSVAPRELPEEVVIAVSARMAEIDAQADLELSLACPACGTTWRDPFDIGSFFWSELNEQALSWLGEVHELASAYGWSETEILSLGSARRQAYLEMLRA